jgi:hypothetical protein
MCIRYREEPEERSKRILEATLGQIQTHGMEDTGLGQIAREAGQFPPESDKQPGSCAQLVYRLSGAFGQGRRQPFYFSQPDAVQDTRDSGSCDPVMRASPHFHKHVARGPHRETFIL